MTQQEEQLLNGLIERVNGTQLASKDAEAEALLRRSLGSNPDALYILCQTVLVQQFAMDKAQRDLTAARAEIDALRQAQPEEKHGSFLGNLFGLGKDDDAPSPQQQMQRVNAPPPYGNPTGYGAGTPGYAPVPNAPGAPPQQYGYPQQPGYPPQGYPAQPGYGYGGQPMGGGGGMFGGGGGFLHGAMQTAAGVVAGEFAFRAIEDMFHGFGGGGERGFGGTEIVNNYYDNDSDRSVEHDGGFGDRLAQADGYDGGISSDIEDRRGESHGFFGGGDDGNTSNFADDSGGLDDGGGFDGGGDFGNDDN